MIETTRLFLRPFHEDDAADVFEYLEKPTVNCFACMKLNSVEEARAEIQKRAEDGEFVRVFESGGYPIILSHWQSLMSNGLRTGLRVLDVIASRINLHYSDKVEWMSFEQLMRLVADNSAEYPIPDCIRKEEKI